MPVQSDTGRSVPVQTAAGVQEGMFGGSYKSNGRSVKVRIGTPNKGTEDEG